MDKNKMIDTLKVVDRMSDIMLQCWTALHAEALVKKLSERKMDISCAESCTAGLVAAAIGSVPGASDVMEASFVTYSEAAKVRFADVSMDTIRTYGVVSPQTAREMAEGAFRCADCGIGVGIGITGYAGPSGEQPGRVCIGVCVLQDGAASGAKDVYCGIDHVFSGDRNTVREKAVAAALVFAVAMLDEMGDVPPAE